MSDKKLFARRNFDLEAQNWFATLSGDCNPMHLDRSYARRTQAGDIVVHGVHAMLWALDAYLGHHPADLGSFTLTARFERFIYVDEAVEARAIDKDDGRRDIELWSGALRVATIFIGPVPASPAAETAVAGVAAAIPPVPVELALDAVAGRAGEITLSGEDDAIALAFPHLAALVGAGAVRTLAGLSTLVGMICPGLHSIFSRLAVTVTADPSGRTLVYAVRRVQPILRLATIDVAGSGVSGLIEAFVRNPPIQQPTIADLAAAIDPELCRGDTVLVLGGSRGLGELTAKLTAIAGAKVIVSYARGKEEAHALADAIIAAGGTCEVIRFDAREPAAPQLRDVIAGVSHCYYYPTPQIFRTRGAAFDPEIMDRFSSIYIDAFAAVAALLAESTQAARLFYPSSTAIDEQPKGAVEYVMAKSAGEVLCDYLDRAHAGLTVQRERLPRLLTDQTATVLPVATGDSVEILQGIIARMHAKAL